MTTFKKDYPEIVDAVVTSPRIVKELHLTPHNQGYLSGVGGTSVSNVNLVHILVPTGDYVADVEVMENDTSDNDVIIGTDVIMFGDFLITNANEKTTFQFRTPHRPHTTCFHLQNYNIFFIPKFFLRKNN